MKRSMYLMTLGLVLVSGTVFGKGAAGTYGTAGCGLGSIVFGNKPGIIQIVAATLNGIGYSQTFGITSGTSNCVAEGDPRSAELFIIGNREQLAKDIARGNGETLANLSEVLGCSNEKSLGAKLQSNYQTIFPNQAIGSEEVSKSIISLSSDCNA